MTVSGDRAADAALWRRWRRSAEAETGDVGAPDAMTLAAYAEGRLDEEGAAPVEDWLLHNPEALAELAAVRATVAEAAPESVIAHAAALIVAGEGNVIPMPLAAARPRGLRAVAIWGGFAASLALTSLAGFSLGSSTYVGFAGAPATGESTLQELFDPPNGLFNAAELEPAT